MDKQARIKHVRSNFPSELLQLTQWVCWRMEERDGKPTKVPYDAGHAYQKAESNNPSTWATFDQACKCFLARNLDGIGFMFSEYDPYIGVDFDKCVSKGVIEPEKLLHIDMLDSYTEFSQSGVGVHVITRGTLPPAGRKSTKHKIEMYEKERFFVVTGAVIGGFPRTISDRQIQIEALHALIFPPTVRQAHRPVTEPAEVPADDHELLERMFASRTGQKIHALWDGHKNGYGDDESAADLALCNYLAFWTGNDPARIDRLFRQSRLYRDKWDRNARTGETYGAGTIARAIAATVETYKPRHMNGASAMGEPEPEYTKQENDSRSQNELPEIQTNNRQIMDVAEQAMNTLLVAIARQPKQPLIYVKGGLLARVAKDEDNYHMVQAATQGSLYTVLGGVARWVKVKSGKEGAETIDHFPPPVVAQYIFNQTDWPGIPALETVVNTPVFGRDGLFHTEPGYSSKTRLYYTGGVTLGDTTPTAANVEAAKNLIMGDLLIDFPFKDDASHAHAIAYLLLPFVRQMIDGPTPLHLFESPTPGTGKGILINACARVALGHDAPTVNEVEDDAEWRKAITSFLMTGKTHFCIDNVNHGLNSGVLANAFTQPYWADRVLGANRDISMKISTIWSASGNNIPISEEIARRCVLIRLDANAQKPWERTGFKHENLKAWVSQHRNALVTACCTFVRAWIEKGKPRYAEKTKGSYESWANVIGGILDVVGITGFLTNENEIFSKTINATELMVDFIKAWWDKYHQGRIADDFAVSSGQLFKLASYSDDDTENKVGDWENLLGELLGSGKQRSRQTKLGILLNEMTDKVIGEYKICARPIKRGQRFFELRRM